MTQASREEHLRELGYEEPFDESPVDVPEGWHGGAVVNTGGNIMCRIWRTWETGERSRDTEFEVIYNTSEDSSIGLQAYTWDEGYQGYTFDHEIRIEEANEHSDHAQAELARKLMLEHNQ
jgi:sugar (pentulose or hexulose) kinase